MSVHLITGYKGTEHIQSKDARSFNTAMFGEGEFVMEIGNELEGSIINNNTVRVLDGDILMQGGHIRIETGTYEDLTITTGAAGKNRTDLIVMTYEKNASDGKEKAFLEVLKGAESEGTSSDPSYTSGSLADGALKNQMPLYRVKVVGVVLTSIEPLFDTIPTYKTLAEQCADQFQEACETYLDSLNILDTMEEIEANTQPNQISGALALKEAISNSASVIKYLDSQKEYVGKNKIPFPYLQMFESNTYSGLTVTINDDGTIEMNGTYTASGNLVLTLYYASNKGLTEEGKKYRLVGCPGGGSDTTYKLELREQDSSSITINRINDTGNGATFTSVNHEKMGLYMIIYPGCVANNLVFKPMLVDADIYPDETCDDFEIHLKNNNELSRDLGLWIGSITISSGNLGYPVRNRYIKETSIIDVYYAEASKEAVQNAGVSYTQSEGELKISFENALEAAVTIANVKVVNP